MAASPGAITAIDYDALGTASLRKTSAPGQLTGPHALKLMQGKCPQTSPLTGMKLTQVRRVVFGAHRAYGRLSHILDGRCCRHHNFFSPLITLLEHGSPYYTIFQDRSVHLRARIVRGGASFWWKCLLLAPLP